MPRARALVAAVPQRVWTAVAGLVLLASLGVSLVVAAGLSTWQGAVTNNPGKGNARPPVSVVTPPTSAVIVVPTPTAGQPAPAAPQHPKPVSVALPAAPAPAVRVLVPVPAPAPASSPPASTPPATPPVTGTPHVVRHNNEGTKGKQAKVEPEHSGRNGDRGKHGKKAAKHGDHGRHLGWAENKHSRQR